MEPARALPRSVPVKSPEPPAPKPVEIEVTRVQSDLVVKPAQDLNRPAAVSSNATTLEGADPSVRTSTNNSKRGFLSRLNPFSGRNKSAPEPVVSESSTPLKSGGAEASTVSAPRYSYLSPLPPTAGSRQEAEKAFKRGLAAYRDGARSVALREYRTAVKADPAYYDAYYNLGLTALDQGETRLSLWAYEIALALRPGGEDARYNFALALKAGGYWNDAADQLRRILEQNTSDARAHLSLANLYSQQLRQPERARDHYRRVLEINPTHPEAAKIRFWLAANP